MSDIPQLEQKRIVNSYQWACRFMMSQTENDFSLLSGMNTIFCQSILQELQKLDTPELRTQLALRHLKTRHKKACEILNIPVHKDDYYLSRKLAEKMLREPSPMPPNNELKKRHLNLTVDAIKNHLAPAVCEISSEDGGNYYSIRCKETIIDWHIETFFRINLVRAKEFSFITLSYDHRIYHTDYTPLFFSSFGHPLNENSIRADNHGITSISRILGLDNFVWMMNSSDSVEANVRQAFSFVEILKSGFSEIVIAP